MHEGVAGPRQRRRHEVGAAAVQGALADLFARAAPEPMDVVRVDDEDAGRIGGVAGLADVAGGTLGVLEQLLGVGERVVAEHVDDQEERALVLAGTVMSVTRFGTGEAERRPAARRCLKD